MAAREKKKKKWTVRFELSLAGLLGLGIVIFCVFLWMFLLGIWAGQTILLPSSTSDRSFPFSRFASGLLEKGMGASLKEMVTESPPPDDPVPATAAPVSGVEWAEQADASGPSVFSLQVGAFTEKERADRVVTNWRAKKYEAFSLSPEGGNEPYYRVMIGRFERLADANAEAVHVETEENTKVYITLIPASKARTP